MARHQHDRRDAGATGERLKEGPPPSAFLRQGATDARPRRLRVRYERAGRSFYSAAAAGGAKMTPAQIAEAQRTGAGVEAESVVHFLFNDLQSSRSKAGRRDKAFRAAQRR